MTQLIRQSNLRVVRTKRRKQEGKDSTKQRLLEAAAELFAEHGFDKVAVRDITEKAGANVAGVNYHFGSREGLVNAVIEGTVNPINEERLARLDAIERKVGKQPPPLEEVVDAFVRPFLTQIRRSELSEKVAFRLIGRMLGEGMVEMPETLQAQMSEVVVRFLKAMSKSLPGVPDDDLVWRVHFMAGGMIHAMAHGDVLQQITRGAAATPSLEQTVSRFVRFAVAGLRQESAPPASKSKKGEAPQSEFLF